MQDRLGPENRPSAQSTRQRLPVRLDRLPGVDQGGKGVRARGNPGAILGRLLSSDWVGLYALVVWFKD